MTHEPSEKNEIVFEEVGDASVPAEEASASVLAFAFAEAAACSPEDLAEVQ